MNDNKNEGESRLKVSRKKLSNRIVLKTNESIYVVSIENIIRCEADGNYTHFFTSENKKITASKTLKEFEELLCESQYFFRIHHSHLINLNFMERFDKKGGGIVVMKDQSNLPVSSRKKNELIALLETL